MLARQYLSALGVIAALCQALPGEEVHSTKLNSEGLRTSLRLGTQFLLSNQKSAGNFHYSYDWERQQYSDQDSQVRQAGAVWGLSIIQAFAPSTEVATALHQALDFMNQHSRRCEDGSRYVVYPRTKRGSTGTVALVALAH